MNPLYRPQALAKVTDPDQLDQSLRLVRPRHLLGFGVVAAVLVAGLAWSLIATAPVKVSGPGVLLSPAGVAAVTSRDTGNVDQLLVRPGDRVVPDQPLALIRSPERIDELSAAEEEASEAQALYQALEREFASQNRHQADLLARMTAATAERIQSLEALLESLTKQRVGEASLRDKGMVSSRQFFETETQLAQTAHDLATARNRITELALEQEQQASKRQQELAEQRLRAQNLRRRADNLRRDYERDRQVLATVTGIVTEIGVDVEDPVKAGQAIAHLLVDREAERGLTAIAYLPAAEGKKVKPDMLAQVSPSTVKFELEGYVLGRVTRVSELPASCEALLRRLRNAVLVDDLLKNGAPVEIEVALQKEATTPSGYAWTSGIGPDIRLEPGTLARTQVVVERVHLISLLFPAMDYVYGWFKAR